MRLWPRLPHGCNPSPVPARKTQRSGATFRRAVFSAKEVPGAQDLSPRAQTHLPFGCSVVGVMWKPKASLNLQKKIFISRSVYGSWSAGCRNRPLVQWICTGLQICKRRFNPLYRATEVFLHFLSLDSATQRSFLHFLSLNLQKKFSSLGLYMVPGQQYVRTGHWSSGYALDYRSASVGSIPSTGLPKFFCTFCHLALPPTEVFCTFCHSICKKKSCSFFSQAKTSLNEKWEHADKCTEVENFHISDKCPFRKALIDITIDHCIQITHLSVLGHKSSLRSQQAFHSTKR